MKKFKPYAKPADVDLAYMAGLIDGEGTINIDIVKKRTNANVHYVFRPSITLVSSTPIITDWANNIFFAWLLFYKK